MTPELKAKWLKDLHSGKYPKTQGRLRDDTGYCCLGVLLETAGIGFSNTWMEYQQYPRWCTPNNLPDGSASNNANELSYAGEKFFGLTRDQARDLMSINDENDTFDPVMQYIVNNL